jgi:hypothetical protein
LELRNPSTGRLHYSCEGELREDPPRLSDGEVESAPDPTRAGADSWPGGIYTGRTLFHGPAFHVIDDITVSEHGLDAVLRGVRSVEWPNEPWASDPALMDGALQLALLWTERQLGGPSLPTAIGRVHILESPGEGRHTARLVGRRTTSNLVECDVSIRSSNGSIVARIEGIETHRFVRRRRRRPSGYRWKYQARNVQL